MEACIHRWEPAFNKVPFRSHWQVASLGRWAESKKSPTGPTKKTDPLKTWVSSSCSKLLRGPLVRSHSIFDELNYIFEWHLTVSYYGLYWNILILEKHNLHHTGQEVFENRSSPFVVTTLPLSVAGPPKLPSVAIWKKNWWCLQKSFSSGISKSQKENPLILPTSSTPRWKPTKKPLKIEIPQKEKVISLPSIHFQVVNSLLLSGRVYYYQPKQCTMNRVCHECPP